MEIQPGSSSEAQADTAKVLYLIKIRLTISGNGELIALGNAGPNDMNSVKKQIIISSNERF